MAPSPIAFHPLRTTPAKATCLDVRLGGVIFPARLPQQAAVAINSYSPGMARGCTRSHARNLAEQWGPAVCRTPVRAYHALRA